MQTRLMTIMFIDVQGFTKRTASQTLEETKVFIEETRTFVQEHLEKWNGKLIKTIGDGFLGSFEAPTSAIQAALEIQRKLEARNANILNPENFVRFRIGINTGEIAVDESGDVFGDPVNIAARIESFCEPNEVFISEATYLAINRNQFQLKDLGPQMFKNATREIRIYKILRHGPELGGASTLTAPKPSMKETVSGGGAHASESKTRLPANWAKIVGAIVAFLLIAALFCVALKKVLQRGKGSGSTATETVALPPLVPLPGLKNGQAPVLVPVPSLASVSAEPKPTAGPATMTSTDEDDEDLSGDEDLLADNPPGEKPMSDKRPRKPGFFKLFA
ncbi:MAG TPA: adenylate/guanylate cyclase domain-containing protein, partial [Candidatus Ozemobacteraceae bacterium]|nr:adenylate/guanylate cyclase domain-containing protein [Candidatus Ozemobacteraceae bacterium]